MSVTPLDVGFLLTTPPKCRGEDDAITDGWRLDDAGLRFLDLHTQGGVWTIETGAGVSTIVGTCEVLARFLDATPGWRRFAELPAAAAFVKEEDGAQHADWVHQPFVYQQSRAARFYPCSTPRIPT